MHGVENSGYILKQRPASRNMEAYQLLILRLERWLLGRNSPEITSYAESLSSPPTLRTVWGRPVQAAGSATQGFTSCAPHKSQIPS